MRRRASAESDRLGEKRSSKLKQFLWCALTAALLLGAYEHWEPEHYQAPEGCGLLPHGIVECTQCALLIAGLAIIGFIARGFIHYEHGSTEKCRYDYRALAEGLRVQFYWLLTGRGDSVASDYMQRQRGELDWIRYAISSLSMPVVERWQQSWDKLSHSDRAQLFRTAQESWVQEQHRYFKGKVIPDPEKPGKSHTEKLARSHHRGWAFLTGGILSIIGHLLSELLHPVHHAFHDHGWQWGLLFVIPALLHGLIRRLFPKPEHAHAHAHGEKPRHWLRILLSHHQTLYQGLALAGIALAAACGLGLLHLDWPAFHGWWIILTSVLMLGGGFHLAWAERNFWAEELRSYTAMLELFRCADRRLSKLIPRFTNATATQAPRLQKEIQFIFYRLGCEALNENAEWLILHRARPLEPFVAG
jgi:hypothetical protein